MFLNCGDGTFEDAVDFPTGGEPFRLVAEDLDGDDLVDIAVTNGYTTHTVAVLYNNPVAASEDNNDNGVPDECESFLRGDVDVSGAIGIEDPLASLFYQFVGVSVFDPPCLDALDFNDNGIVDVTDPLNNLTYQFLGTTPPAPPIGNCGSDPTTSDGFDCARGPSCP